MKIDGLQKLTTIDYPGKLACVVFLVGCNYNCGYCHNPELKEIGEGDISEQEFFNYIDSRKKWIDGVVVSGGEPTLQTGLPEFIEKIKQRNYFVKLDTNGNNPTILNELRKKNLIDYVAMDVKGPIYLYSKIVGKEIMDERDGIGKGITVTSRFPNYEFRTTVAPLYEDGRIRWMTPKEIGDTTKLIYNYTGNREHKYFLQKFKAIKKERGNELFLEKNLSEKMRETPAKYLKECLIEARKHLPNSNIRR